MGCPATPRRRGRRASAGRAGEAGGSSSRRGRSQAKRPRGLSAAEVERLAGEAAKIASARLALDHLGVPPEDALEIIEDIASSIAEQYSSKPQPEAIARRIEAQRDVLLKAVAARLVERRGEDLSLQQLELVVQAAPEVAGRAAPLLYRAAAKHRADYIADALRGLWIRYGSPTKAECPRCGFRALTPEFTCLVCGSSVDESEVKQALGFEGLLESWALTAPSEMVREALRAGFVYYEDGEIRAPSEPHSAMALQLFLNRRERAVLEEALKKRESRGAVFSSGP